MSAEAIIASLLSAAVGVTAIVDDNIYPMELPEGIAPPAVVYRLISQVQHQDVSLAQAITLMTARIQVDAVTSSDDFPGRKALLLAVRRACHGHIGTVAGFSGVVVQFAGEGPDLQYERAGLSSGSVDFKVVFQQAAT